MILKQTFIKRIPSLGMPRGHASSDQLKSKTFQNVLILAIESIGASSPNCKFFRNLEQCTHPKSQMAVLLCSTPIAY